MMEEEEEGIERWRGRRRTERRGGGGETAGRRISDLGHIPANSCPALWVSYRIEGNTMLSPLFNLARINRDTVLCTTIFWDSHPKSEISKYLMLDPFCRMELI